MSTVWDTIVGASSIGLKLLVISFAPIFWSHKTTHEEVTNTGPPQIQINRIGLLVLKLCLVEVYSVRRERERERERTFSFLLENITMFYDSAKHLPLTGPFPQVKIFTHRIHLGESLRPQMQTTSPKWLYGWQNRYALQNDHWRRTAGNGCSPSQWKDGKWSFDRIPSWKCLVLVVTVAGWRNHPQWLPRTLNLHPKHQETQLLCFPPDPQRLAWQFTTTPMWVRTKSMDLWVPARCRRLKCSLHWLRGLVAGLMFSPLNCGFVTLAKGETFGGYHRGHKFVKVSHHLWDNSGIQGTFSGQRSWIM